MHLFRLHDVLRIRDRFLFIIVFSCQPEQGGFNTAETGHFDLDRWAVVKHLGQVDESDQNNAMYFCINIQQWSVNIDRISFFRGHYQTFTQNYLSFSQVVLLELQDFQNLEFDNKRLSGFNEIFPILTDLAWSDMLDASVSRSYSSEMFHTSNKAWRMYVLVFSVKNIFFVLVIFIGIRLFNLKWDVSSLHSRAQKIGHARIHPHAHAQTQNYHMYVTQK